MRKFLLKLSVFMAYAFFIQVILPVLADPYNIFHAENIRTTGVAANRTYIKMKYILNNPDKFDGFIFGSSRVGALHNDKMTDGKIYNMASPGGVPRWHLLNIKTFLKNGIIPKKIYMGIDASTYNGDYEGHINSPVACPYEYVEGNFARMAFLYLDTAMVFKALTRTIAAKMVNFVQVDPIDTEIFYKYGYDIGYKPTRKFDWKNKYNLVPGYEAKEPHIDQTLQYIREISEICRDNGIEFTLFINPIHHIIYAGAVRDRDYFRFLEGLVEICDFWNFSSLNDVTMNNDNYMETIHFLAGPGDMMINAMCYGKTYPELNAQGFGVKVTRENAKDFIVMLRKQFEDYEKSQQ